MYGIIKENPTRLAYLAGAGISIPPPAHLPGAVQLITALTEKIASDPGLKAAIKNRLFTENAGKRFEGDFLRFESVLSCIRLTIDPDLELLRLYSDCVLPNAYHHFLAGQLEQGAILLTTNFDNLLEHTCRARNIHYTLLASDEELSAFGENPASFQNPILKLHGGYDLLDSDGSVRQGAQQIKAAIEHVGRLYFSGPSNHLAAAIEATLKTRHLVVMGYSGCDDFDIMPSLLAQPALNGFTWIHHDHHPPRQVKQLPTDWQNHPPFRLMKANENNNQHIQIISGDTAAVFDIDTKDDPSGEQPNWNTRLADWANKYLATTAQQNLLFGYLLSLLERFEESVATLEKIHEEALSHRQNGIRQLILCNIIPILNDSERAILTLSALTESEHVIDGTSIKGVAYYNLARVNTDRNQYKEAELYLNAAMKIFEKQGDVVRMADALHELGRIATETGDVKKSLKYYETANKISEAIGHLTGTALGYTQIAMSLYQKGQLDEAEAFAHKAIKILRLNGDQTGLAIAHHTLGFILSLRENVEEAAWEFETAVHYARSSGAKRHLGHSLHCLGNMCLNMMQLDKAQICLEESLEIKRRIGDHQGIQNSTRLLEIVQRLKNEGFS